MKLFAMSPSCNSPTDPQTYLVYNHTQSLLDGQNVFDSAVYPGFTTDIPAAWDWRNQGALNPVQNQGMCRSCWAFSTTSVLESLFFIKHNELRKFSEQFAVNCNHGLFEEDVNSGCAGGYPESAFIYNQFGGIPGVREVSSSDACTNDQSPLTVTGTYMIHPGDNVALKYAVFKSPVVVELDASSPSFQHYTSGIITTIDSPNSIRVQCSSLFDDATHAVTIVGYGTQPATDGASSIDYWIVRNSWGSSWGENGYFRMERSSSANDAGVCGIANFGAFASIE